MANAVDEAQIERLAPRPEGAGEQLAILALELAGAAIAYERLEGIVNLELDGLQALDVLRLFRLERVEDRLVLAGGMDAALDTDLFHCLDQTDTGHTDTHRSDDHACPSLGAL